MRNSPAPQRIRGIVEFVETGTVGSETTSAPYDVRVDVLDVSDFPPDGGFVDFGQAGAPIEYLSYTVADDDLGGTLLFAAPLAAYPVGTRADVWINGSVATEYIAGALTVDGYLVPATLTTEMATHLPEGPRPVGQGERVVLVWADEAWLLNEIEGMVPDLAGLTEVPPVVTDAIGLSVSSVDDAIGGTP